MNQYDFNSASVTHDHNSFDSNVYVDNSDFVSLDSSCMDDPRKADGSLPDCDFLKLKAGSDLINAGTPISGKTTDGYGHTIVGNPDMGAYESGTVLGASTYNFTLDLKYGVKGDEVKALQNLMFILGYLNVTPTGNFGPATVEAVKKYQQANGLAIDGVVGAQTRLLLNKDSGKNSLYR